MKIVFALMIIMDGYAIDASARWTEASLFETHESCLEARYHLSSFHDGDRLVVTRYICVAKIWDK